MKGSIQRDLFKRNQARHLISNSPNASPVSLLQPNADKTQMFTDANLILSFPYHPRFCTNTIFSGGPVCLLDPLAAVQEFLESGCAQASVVVEGSLAVEEAPFFRRELVSGASAT